MSLTPRLDTIQTVSDSFTGQITMFGGNVDPTGWLICDGRAVDRTIYSTLFATIGTNFGEGDGTTSFNLPDARGGFARGAVNIPNRVFGGTDTFVDGDVIIDTTNTITLTTHTFVNYQRIQLTTSGVLPAGLSLATDYFIIVVDANTVKLASSRANAVAGTEVVISAAAGGGTHTVTANEVDTTAETINIYNHGLNRTGFAVRFSTSAADLPAGLVIDTTYYVRVIDSDNFELYDSRAEAIDTGATTGRRDLTDIGTGYHTLEQWEDPDASARVAHAVGGGTGDTIGAGQGCEIQSHTHSYKIRTSQGQNPEAAGGTNSNIGNGATLASGGNETRPCNFLVNYIIKI